MSTRLLLVDDEECIREIEASMLSPLGYEFTQASDGEEALAILDSEKKFDLVISDIMMPRVDGITLLQTIKQRYPELPVLIVSAVYDKEISRLACEYGAYAYVLAPFERQELLDAVRGALASSPSAGRS